MLVLCMVIGLVAPLLLYQINPPMLTASSVVTLKYDVAQEKTVNGRKVITYSPAEDLTAPDGSGELEANISALVAKREAVMTDFANLIQLYNNKYVNDSTVSVFGYHYKAPSLLSGAFIKQTIKIAGAFCIVGFIVCMILLIHSRRKEEKA